MNLQGSGWEFQRSPFGASPQSLTEAGWARSPVLAAAARAGYHLLPERRSGGLFVGARRGLSKWRLGVWLVLVGCVAVVAAVLVEGLLNSAEFMLKLEVFAGIFVVGCLFLLVSGRSARKKREGESRR
jgi:hypothetical protein